MDHRYNCKTIKLLEENRVENLCDLWFGKEFLDSTPKRWPIKEKWVNWTSWELAIFSSVKRTILRMKRQATNCKKILGNHLFHKGLGKARIYKAFSKFNSKTTTQLKDGQKTGTSTWSIVTAWPFAKWFLGTNSRYEEDPKEDALNYSLQHNLSEFYSFLKALILFRLSTFMWDPRQGFFSPSCR